MRGITTGSLLRDHLRIQSSIYETQASQLDPQEESQGDSQGSNSQNFEVDSILDSKTDLYGNLSYHVQWAGGQVDAEGELLQQSWEPRSNFAAPEKIAHFHTENPEADNYYIEWTAKKGPMQDLEKSSGSADTEENGHIIYGHWFVDVTKGPNQFSKWHSPNFKQLGFNLRI